MADSDPNPGHEATVDGAPGDGVRDRAPGAGPGAPRLRAWVRLARRGDLLLGAAIGACAAFSLAQLLLYGFGRDQAIYAAVADEMARGGAPYADAWDFKPPGIFFIYLLARVFGSGEHAIRVVEVLAWLSLILAFTRLSRRHLGGPLGGLMGGCLATIVVSQLEFWHTAQPESFAAVALAWAVLLASTGAGAGPRPTGRQELLAWAGAGACFTLAGLLKFPHGGGILISWVLLCRRSIRAARLEGDGLGRCARAALRPTLALTGGALAVLGPLLLYFARAGALRALGETLFVFAPEYTKIGGWSFTAFLLGIYPALREVLAGFSPLLLVGVLLLGVTGRARGGSEPLGHALGAFAFAVIAVPLQGKGFAYHYVPALALCALFAGVGYGELLASLRGRPVRSLLVLLAFAVVYRAYPAMRTTPIPYFQRVRDRMRSLRLPGPERRRLLARLSSAGDVDGVANREAAAWVADYTAPGAHVYVWGFEPSIYVYARRRPASRYIYNVPQRASWSRQRYRPRLLEDLDRRPPAVILVEKGDRYSWVTGDEQDSLGALAGFTELRARLERDYRKEKTSAKFVFYVRQSPPPAGTAAP